MQFADGRTRAFVNDQPVSVQALRALGAALVEIHGQHDERALVDAATHRALLDAFGELDARRRARWRGCGRSGAHARRALAAHRAEVERAQREADWLRHAVEELAQARAGGRRRKRAGRAPRRHDAGREGRRRSARGARRRGRPQSPVPALSAAVRRLERRAAQAPALIEPAVKALDAALTALDEARAHLEQALRAADHDPRELERIEERLFALRAAARKYNVPVDELDALATRYAADLALIDAGAERLAALEQAAREAADALSRRRGRAVGSAAQGRREARQGRQRRAQAAQARAREILDRDREPSRRRAVRTASTVSSSGCRPIRARGRAR